VNIGESIGNALAGGSFGNVLQGFAAEIGGLLETMGKLLIQTALKVELFKKALYTWAVAHPALAIAAGIGLVAFGKVIAKTATPQLSGSHASGLKRVPKDGYIAELHKDEMVVPAKQSEKLRAMMNPDFSIKGINIPSFGGIQIPNIQISQPRAPQLPSSNIARFNPSFMQDNSKKSIDVSVDVTGRVSGDDLVLLHSRTLRKQKLSY
jgi:hypothetical protein